MYETPDGGTSTPTLGTGNDKRLSTTLREEPNPPVKVSTPRGSSVVTGLTGASRGWGTLDSGVQTVDPRGSGARQSPRCVRDGHSKRRSGASCDSRGNSSSHFHSPGRVPVSLRGETRSIGHPSSGNQRTGTSDPGSHSLVHTRVLSPPLSSGLGVKGHPLPRRLTCEPHVVCHLRSVSLMVSGWTRRTVSEVEAEPADGGHGPTLGREGLGYRSRQGPDQAPPDGTPEVVAERDPVPL